MTYRTNAEQSEPDEPQPDEDSSPWQETLEAIKDVAREAAATGVDYAELLLAIAIMSVATAAVVLFAN